MASLTRRLYYRRPAGSRALRPRRIGQVLQVARDGADVVVVDEALPGRHGGARTSVADDPQEIVLRSLERLEIGGDRRALGVDAVALRALGQERRAREAKLGAERGGGGGLGGRADAVPREDRGQRAGLELPERAVELVLEREVDLAHGGADRHVAGGVDNLHQAEAGLMRHEPPAQR